MGAQRSTALGVLRRVALPSRPLERRCEALDLLIGQRLFDQWKEDALLVADVALEALAELSQLRGSRGRAGLDL